MSDEPKELRCRKCGCRHLMTVGTAAAPRQRMCVTKECRNCGTRMNCSFKVPEGFEAPMPQPRPTGADEMKLMERFWRLFGF